MTSLSFHLLQTFYGVAAAAAGAPGRAVRVGGGARALQAPAAAGYLQLVQPAALQHGARPQPHAPPQEHLHMTTEFNLT